MNGVTIGMGVVAVVCGLGTTYVALGNTVPSLVLVVAGTALTIFFGLGTVSGASTIKEA